MNRVARMSAAVLLVSTSAAACSGADDQRRALDAFLAGWRAGKLDTVAFIGPAGGKLAAADVLAELQGIAGELAATPPQLTPEGKPTTTAGVTNATVAVDWSLPGGGHWTYPTTVRMRENSDAWQVIWEPAVLHPQVTKGDRLAVRRAPAARASILDGEGKPLFEERAVVDLGLEPQKITDMGELKKRLGDALTKVDAGIDMNDVENQVKEAKPDAFVSVVTLRQAKYDQIREQIAPLPGLLARNRKQLLSPDRAFARGLLGQVGQATAEDLTKRPGVLKNGDLVGHGGLQGAFDERLRGKPAERVVATRKAPDGTVNEEELFAGQPQPGTPVKTTLDRKVQTAADAALAPEKRRAALVIVRVSDGAVVAAANGPNGGSDNLAFTAQVPPGSTFKVITAYAAVDRGLASENKQVDCPRTLVVDGREFRNSHEIPVKLTLRGNMAESCNTAFAAFAPQLGPDGLATAAKTLGIGAPWEVGVHAFSGRVPTGKGPAEMAAAAFGQGTTVVSPLAMATAVATVAAGQFHAPKLVTDPAPANALPDGPPLKKETVDQLRSMMRAVVTDDNGTAKKLRTAPGGPVHAKSGTAEWQNDAANAHSWLVGFQGDLAFAAFVEEGGAGADAALPVVERFLNSLHGR